MDKLGTLALLKTLLKTSCCSCCCVIFILHPVGQIGCPGGPVMARGPYVWHPCPKPKHSFIYHSSANATLRASGMPSVQNVIFKAAKQVRWSGILTLHCQVKVTWRIWFLGQCAWTGLNICVWQLDKIFQQDKPRAWNHSQVMNSDYNILNFYKVQFTLGE